MDRPSQDSGPPSDTGESPLSFPVEAPKLAGVEPGTGAPLGLPAEARPLGGPLAFPAEASAGPPSIPPASPFQAESPRLAELTPLPFPVAELPGSAAAAAAATAPPPDPAAGHGPVPLPAPPSSELLRFVPPALTSVAALMVVGGCFLPLFRIQQHLNVGQRFFEAQLTVTKTAWATLIDIPGQEAADRPGAPLGIPLVIVAALLAVAAVAAFSRPGRGFARRLVSASAVFTAGVVTTVGMSRFEWSALLGAEDLEVTTAPGMWLLISATVLAAAAAVVASLPAWKGSTQDWADPAIAYTDTPTPPSGVAITVLPPDPEDDEQRP
ncbi:hypothetical protein [Amycolatopsis sp. NPDC051128]|uniref:hypothetical protein n=1 Tax=Amycolatopsis sp. NPDC051128 TaxID=3155412 RepID=UPI00341A48E1